MKIAQEDEEFAETDEGHKILKNMIGGNDIIQIKSTFILNGLIPLENIFDHNYVAKKPKVQLQED